MFGLKSGEVSVGGSEGGVVTRSTRFTLNPRPHAQRPPWCAGVSVTRPPEGPGLSPPDSSATAPIMLTEESRPAVC